MSGPVFHRGGRGRPLVLIHGIGSRWQVWEPVLGALQAEREVIALDLPGFGASPMPAAGTAPGIDSLVQLTGAFLSDLGIERPDVAGNSLGGLIVLEMARRGLVRSATALSPAGFANRAESAGARGTLRVSAALARRLSGRADRLMRSPLARRVAYSGTVAHPERMSAADAAANLRGLASAPWFAATLPTVGPMAFRDGAQIAVPVTIGWGTKDRLLLPRQARRAARAIPSARVVMLQDCGHVPMYDDPAAVARLILETSA
ncbi:MAG TPA: alpha/beta fold hydrolase [Solirubrobacteraceae bacterium]|nr:alpha/beta fold hydrolase [Solirubrobacteraceae bacterium]